MHPAYSVIAFTTAAGAGYGLQVWLSVGGVLIQAGALVNGTSIARETSLFRRDGPLQIQLANDVAGVALEAEVHAVGHGEALGQQGVSMPSGDQLEASGVHGRNWISGQLPGLLRFPVRISDKAKSIAHSRAFMVRLMSANLTS